MSFNVIKALCVCGCVFGGMCDDVRGMEKLYISERCQFFALNAVSMDGVDSVEFSHQYIDAEFFSQWARISNKNLKEIRFNMCTFVDDFGYGILDNAVLTSLSVTNCGITASDSRNFLLGIYPYTIEYIDFSNNKLGQDESVFRQVLQDNVFFIMGGVTFDLRGNDFSKTFIKDTVNADASIRFIF